MTIAATTQIIATYGGRQLDPYWDDVLVLFDCDAARYYFPQIVCGDSIHGWVAYQQQDSNGLPQTLWYHSSTPDGTFQYTGKIASVFASFIPELSVKNSTVCVSITPGSAGPVMYTNAGLSQVPLDILGPSIPGQITTNIDLKDARFLASNGTDLYLFGSISGWNTPNEVYKSTDNGVNWVYLGTMSGVTFPFDFGGEGNFGNAVVRKIGNRWFLLDTNFGIAGGTDGRRVFYTDSVDPVTGWTAATGIDIDPDNFNEQIARYITYDGISTLYLSKTTLSNIELYRSTDNGATWILDYVHSRAVNEIVLAWDTTNPAIGGKVRATLAGINTGYWLEHTIGNPNGTWVQRSFNTQMPSWQVSTVTPFGQQTGSAPPTTFIDNLNSGGIAMGCVIVQSSSVGALTYTVGPNTNLNYNPSPYFLYSQYPLQLANDEYYTRFPAYSQGYIDTNFYKYGTVPGRRRHNTSPGSLRCNGNRTWSPTFLEWNIGAVDWTVEFWMYTSTPNQFCTVFNTINFDDGFGWFNFMLLGGNLSLFCFDNNNNFLADMNSIVSLPLDQWNFITGQRSGGVITLYLNGTSVATSSFSPSAGTYYSSNSYINFGTYADSGLPYIGWLDDIRVTKDVARYSGNFTPPWGPFPDRGPF